VIAHKRKDKWTTFPKKFALSKISGGKELFKGIRYCSRFCFRVRAEILTDLKVVRLLAKMKPIEQLVIDYSSRTNLEQGLDLPIVHRCINFYGSALDVGLLNFSHIQEMNFRNWSTITDVNCLYGVRKLCIEKCNCISDISGLGNIPNLSLLYCYGIRDVSALKNNVTLTILHCPNIDCSTVNFENILYFTTNINMTNEAASTLKKAQTIQLTHFIGSAIFLSSTVSSLYLGNPFAFAPEPNRPELFSISNFSSSFLSSVTINRIKLDDLTPLYGVKKLTLSSCPHLTHVHGLGNHERVTIDDDWNITDLSALKIVRRCTNVQLLLSVKI
jgi:hypothetical protein